MRKNSGKGEKIIDRVLSRFKMAKRGSQSPGTINQSEITEKNPFTEKGMENSGKRDIQVTSDSDVDNKKVSLKNLPGFCDKLEKFIKHIRNMEDLGFLVHDYPIVVKNRLDNDVLELEIILKEINSSLTNINKIKAQRSYVRKENAAVKKVLNRMRDDESREMERVVALYDKALFARWENVKTTHKPELLNNLLTDIKCKELALENLETLVSRKLTNLKTFSDLSTNKSVKKNKDNVLIPVEFSSTCSTKKNNSNEKKSRIPIAPPLPPPPDFTVTNNFPSLSMQIRRRPEEDYDYDEYSLLRDMDDLLEIQALTTFTSVPNNLVVNLDGNDNSGLLSSSQYSSETITLNSESLEASLQDEIRSVLQVSHHLSSVV